MDEISEPASAPVPVRVPRVGPRDVFLHLFSILALYLSALSFGSLLFRFIDLTFPDPLALEAFSRFSAPIRWAVASLLIVFPAYVWSSWFLEREVRRFPEKRGLRTRKWLFHFTLFAAAIVIGGDLIALVYNFLGGDLTTRFILKVAAVLVIAAAVFGYYLWNLRSEVQAIRHPRMRLFVVAVIAAVTLSLLAGFATIGSPFRERLRRFDERRTQDLQSLQWQVVSFWQQKDRLPASLDELRDDISGFAPPSDPETGAPYGYRALGDLSFELCAAFKTTSDAPGRGGDRWTGPSYAPQIGIAPVPAKPADSWSHGAGRVCFERTIDPELYRTERSARK